MRKLLLLSLSLSLGTSAAGCAIDVEHEDEVIQEAQLAGKTYNGKTYNGKTYNGKTYNGKTYNGKTYNGGSLNGKAVVGVRAERTVLHGTDSGSLLLGMQDNSGGSNVSGKDFEGARFPSTLDDGTPVELEIDRIEHGGSYDHGGVLLHHVWVLTSPNVRHALCHNDAMAVPIPGYWQTDSGVYVNDPTTVTFACVNASIGKCALLGFDPSVPGQEAGHHACVRAIRGDYCGSGEAYTKDGNAVNIWDRNQSTEKDTESWPVDAEWTPEGAVCLAPEGKQRWQDRVAEEGPDALPPCLGTAHQDTTYDGSFVIAWNETMFRAGCGQSDKLNPATVLVTEHFYDTGDPGSVLDEAVEEVGRSLPAIDGRQPASALVDTVCATSGVCFSDFE